MNRMVRVWGCSGWMVRTLHSTLVLLYASNYQVSCFGVVPLHGLAQHPRFIQIAVISSAIDDNSRRAIHGLYLIASTDCDHLRSRGWMPV